MYYIVSKELYHHGIKGQKWGVRRFQNEDGSLTTKGVKRYGAQYKKEMAKFEKAKNAANERLMIDSYNKTADEYNNGKIAEYNKKHKTTDSDYAQEYEKQFKKDWEKNYNKSVMEFASNNKHYQKAEAISKKYNLDTVDDLAERNKMFVDTMMN